MLSIAIVGILAASSAPPALASGEPPLPAEPAPTALPGLEPPALPEPPPVPTVEIPVPEPELVPVQDPTAAGAAAEGLEGGEPVVSATRSGEGDVVASVRVLSPGDDGTAPEDASGSFGDVVSTSDEADITPRPEEASASPARPTSVEAAEGDEDGHGPRGSAAANLNVSVRVGSAGDDGTVRQDASGDGQLDAATASRGGPDISVSVRVRSPGDNETPASDGYDASRYHEPHSQYQLDQQPGFEPWNWTWLLTVDCGGNASSTSSETGAPESLVWTWSWMWKWGCESSRRPPQKSRDPPDAGAGARGPTEAVPDDPSEPSAKWTWMFRVCEDVTSLSTQFATHSALTWSWNWQWEWECARTSPPSAAPASGPGPRTAPVPSAIAPDAATDEAAQQVVPGFVEVAGGVILATALPAADIAMVLSGTPALDVLAMVATPAGRSSLVISRGVAAPGGTAGRTTMPSAPARGRGASRRGRPSGDRADTVPPAMRSPASPDGEAGTTARAESTGPREARPDRRRDITARPAPARSRERSKSPIEPAQTIQPNGSTAPAAAGALVLLLLVATLIGIPVLAAPGLGRRIRPAREPSPRSRYREPIDHPG